MAVSVDWRGSLHITASDDGINAAGGSDSSGGMGQGSMGKGDHKQDTPGGTAGEPPQKGKPQGSPQAEPGQAPAGRP